jgi:2-methylisocitrate lyase-like PEP mutase family enzyme
LLVPKDSSLVNGAVADENGVFTIADVAPGNYVLRVTNMGYQTLYRSNVKLAAEASLLDLGSITVQPEAHKLAEVIVKGEKT